MFDMIFKCKFVWRKYSVCWGLMAHSKLTNSETSNIVVLFSLNALEARTIKITKKHKQQTLHNKAKFPLRDLWTIFFTLVSAAREGAKRLTQNFKPICLWNTKLISFLRFFKIDQSSLRNLKMLLNYSLFSTSKPVGVTHFQSVIPFHWSSSFLFNSIQTVDRSFSINSFL